MMMMRALGRFAVAVMVLLQSTLASAQLDPNRTPPSLDPARTANGLAPTPPMGWNSWNRFGCEVNEAIVRKAADRIVATGMAGAGYRFVVIDDCWHGKRDGAGFITADPARFPSGIKALADYVHSRGLKFGIYSDAGAMTCGKRPGSQGHEYQDALTYARWGVDYLKYDWCYTGSRNAEEAYALMAEALKASGRPIVFSICEWGQNQPWKWAARIGNLWRTTGDIGDHWQGKRDWRLGIVDIADLNEPLAAYAGPGHWNDPDMLEIGNGGMSDTEYRSHFSLWAMMAAPLMAGNDLDRMTPALADILLNREVIAVDQDRLGRQGRRVSRDGDAELWARPLADGGAALLLFNRGSRARAIDWSAADAGFAPGARLGVRDLWAHRALGSASGGRLTVAPHGVIMLRLTPASAERTHRG
ncbi:glycoside hydrolase family 27 protein [Sphingomonas sp. ASV193]|uniref:glycoside hydrolase family 27 protein n=1 Tax=Sphingomonas sp. ASV193 TaxID=3144405 RepID=UPI0032E92E33